MANYKSRVFLGTNKFRSIREGVDSLEATIRIPALTVLVANDILSFFKIAPNVVPLTVALRTSILGTGTGLLMDVGYGAENLSDAAYVALATDDDFITGTAIGLVTAGQVMVDNASNQASGSKFVVDYLPLATTQDIKVVVRGIPSTQDVAALGAANVDRFVTLTMTFQSDKTRLSEVDLFYNYGA